MERNSAVKRPQLTSPHPQHGAALLLAIFALAAISHVSLRLVTHTLGYRNMLRTYTDSIKHHHALRSNVQPLTSEYRACETQQLRGGTIAGITPRLQEWFVCSLGRIPFLSNQHSAPQPVAFDYAALFQQPSPCAHQRSRIGLTTFTTPMAAFTCHLPEHLIGSIRLLDNIAIESSIVAPSTSTEVGTIVTPGSLIVSSTLSVSGNSILVAGGDIRIPILRLHQARAAEVTIISAHGDILVERIEGAISLLTHGRRAIAAPQTAPPSSPPLPPLRGPSVSGIIPR